jgi:hypothetical protein
MKIEDWPFGERYPASNGAVLFALLFLGWCIAMATIANIF